VEGSSVHTGEEEGVVMDVSVDNGSELIEDVEEDEVDLSAGQNAMEVQGPWDASGSMLNRKQSAFVPLGREVDVKAFDKQAAAEVVRSAKEERDDRDMADCLRFLKDGGASH
jgi:hypothetical protein